MIRLRNPNFRTVIHSVRPDILAAQEITSQAGVNDFLNNVMNSSGNNYSAGTYIEDPNIDIGIFYKTLGFTLLSITSIHTNQMNIFQFELKHNSSNTIYIIKDVDNSKLFNIINFLGMQR